MASIIISLSDLMLLDSWKQAAKEDNKKDMYRVLFLNGVDIKKPFTYEYCTHRNLQGQIVTCERIVGHERSDEAFLKSGYASYQVRVEARGDGSFSRHIDGMGYRPLVSAEGGYDSRDYDKS